MTVVRPELEMPRRGTGSPSEGTHEFARAASAIFGFRDTCDFVVTEYASHAVGVNAALTYIRVTLGGGFVYGEEGTYTITESIVLVSNLLFKCAGIEATIFQGGGNIDIFTNYDYAGDGIDHVYIMDFTIDGVSATYQGSGIKVRSVDYMITQRVKAHDCWFDFYQLNIEDDDAADSIYIYILECEYHSCGLVGGANTSDGIALHSLSYFGLENIYGYNSGNAGILITRHSDGHNNYHGYISGCWELTTAAAETFVFSYCYDLTVDACYGYDAHTYSMRVAISERIYVWAFESDSSGTQGIYLNLVEDFVFVGGSSHDSGQVTAASGQGVYVINCTDGKFFGLQSFDNLQDGWIVISEDGDVHNILLRDCDGKDNADDGFWCDEQGTGHCQKIMIFGGNWYGNGGNGIEIGTDVEDTWIRAPNFYTGNVAANVLDSGTRTRWPEHYTKVIMNSLGNGRSGSQTPVVGRVYLTHFQVHSPLYIDTINYFAREAVAGNVHLGVYEDNGATPAGGALLVDSGSVAVGAGTFQWHCSAVTETYLRPGSYWFAVECDDTAMRLEKVETGDPTTCLWLDGWRYDRAGGYGALTDPCPAVTAEIAIMLSGISSRMALT